MSVKAQATGIIDQPVSRVFQFHAVEHIQNHPRWDPKMHLEELTDGPMDVGKMIKRINSHSGQPVEGTMEVTEFMPDKAVTMIIHDGPVMLIARATYETEGDNKTRLTMNVEFPNLDEMNTEALMTAMQGSIHNINQLMTTENDD
jgi:hypothetical protein